VVDAQNGQTLQEVTAVESGFLFTIREHPLVYPGALLGRIAKIT
jgi:predicted deacylase